jgi:hypothetical protein
MGGNEQVKGVTAHLPQLLSFVQCKPAYVFVLYMPVPILAGRCWLMDALRPVKRNQGVLIAVVKEVAADNTAQGVATLGGRERTGREAQLMAGPQISQQQATVRLVFWPRTSQGPTQYVMKTRFRTRHLEFSYMQKGMETGYYCPGLMIGSITYGSDSMACR